MNPQWQDPPVVLGLPAPLPPSLVAMVDGRTSYKLTEVDVYMAHLTRQCCAYCGGSYMRHFPNAPGSTVDFCRTFQTPVGRKICLDKPSDHWPVQPRETINQLDSPPPTESGLYDRFMAASKLLPDFKSAEPVTIDLHSALYVRITFWNNSNVPELVLPSQNFSRVAYLAFEHIRTHHDENIRRREVEIRSMDGQIVRTIAPGMRLMAAIKKDIHINDSPGGSSAVTLGSRVGRFSECCSGGAVAQGTLTVSIWTSGVSKSTARFETLPQTDWRHLFPRLMARSSHRQCHSAWAVAWQSEL